MGVTKNIRQYVNDIGINLSDLARKAKVSYANIYNSLREDGSRELQADELMAICEVLKINPVDYCDNP